MIEYLQNKKYKIEKIIGQGGFGITYKAIMKETVSGSLGNMEVDVPVAIKEFFMKDTCEREEGTGKITVPSQGSRAVVELYRKKFVKEAKNLAQMNHPHIVKVVDVFEENDTVYYVMQYLSGGSLADYVKQHGALDEAIAIKYIQQIGSALEYMHQKHICHYDVKPTNILLDDKGGAMLIDFGISKGYTEEGHQTSSTPVGISAGYAPLEQYQQNLQDFSPATDVYGLAATLYFLVTGKVPAEASIVLNDGIGRKSDGISAKLWRSVERGMCPRKNDRFQNISDFIGSISVGETTIVSKKTFVNEFEAPIASSTTNAIAGKGKGKWARTIFMSLLTISMLLSLIKVGYVKVHQHIVINELVDNMVKVKGGTVDGVTFSDFYIGKYEITNEEYDAVMDERPVYRLIFAQMGGVEAYNNKHRIKNEAAMGKKHHPKIVSRKQVLEFLERLNEKTGKQYRLPTDLEWEVAAKGGICGHGYKYSGGNDILGVANFYNGKKTNLEDVGQKRPNELGLYDMTGNVDELCDNACIDINDKRWSVRGGCCLDEASESLVTSKKPLGTNCLVGFRLALGNSGIREEGYVDLGLSVKWAKCNLGAKTPEDAGDRFAWGETATKESFDMENYKYRNNPIMHSVSLTNNDAAYVLLGKHWKMPTKKEMQELLDKCTWTWKEVKGIKGYIVKSKVNGNSIFLPGMMGKYETIGKFENGCWGLWFSNSIRTNKSFFIPAVSNNDINMCRNGDNISLFFYYAGYWTGSYGDLRTIPFLYLSVSVESGTNSKPIFDNFFAFGYAGLYIRPVYVD